MADCLQSLRQAKRPKDDWQIVVVDNQSADDSVAYVRKHFPEVKLIVNSRNLGFSAGNNVALKRVTTPYTLLLNPDTVVYPGTIQTVLDYVAPRPEIGAATCRVELPDGSLDYSCHRRFPDPWNSFVYFFTGGLKKFSRYADNHIPDTIHDIDALTGAFALIRTAVGKKINWFDEDFFWNGEDLDLCYRIKELGYRIVYLPQVKITHFKGSSSGLYKTGKYKISKSAQLRSAEFGITAMRIFYAKHLAAKYPAVFNAFVSLGMSVLHFWRQAKIYLT